MDKANISGQVPLLDVSRSNGPLRDEILTAISDIFDSGRFIGGDACRQFEADFAEACGVEFAVGCASGSDALLLALMALDIGPGDEVVVPSFTFFATASAVWRLGARPVFADVCPLTMNLDPASLESCITSQTRAVIPVHLFGQCADMDAIGDIADRYGLYVIEDAAQAIGATYRGKKAGSMGHVGCFSFYPTKNLGGLGDGGMCTSNDPRIAENLRLMANHGMQPRYVHSVVGVNSRLDAIQAVALAIKLRHLDTWTQQRAENAATYHQLFEQAGLDNVMRLPATDANCGHVWNQYTVRVANAQTRDQLRESLKGRGVGTEIYYPIPLHLQRCFASLGYRPGELPMTEDASNQVISLPIFPGLTTAEQQAVVNCISQYLQAPPTLSRAA